MKIYIQNIKPKMSPYNGKGKFIQLLAKEFESRKGIKIVKKPVDCDINFRMNHLPSTEYGKKVVRLDGFNFTLTNLQAISDDKCDITKTLQLADGIIFQSLYARNLLYQYTDIDAEEEDFKIIPNGVDPADFKPEFDINILKKYYLFACQTLHPIRRLESLLNVWQQYNSKKWLYVIFDHAKNYTDIDFSLYKNVKVFNIMEQDQLNHYIKNAIALINLTYRDSCPNIIIEALACGTPVIADKESGIWEYLSELQGQQVDITLPGNEGRFPIKNPQEIMRAMDYYKNFSRQVELPSCLKIKSVADKYIKFFKELL